MKRSLLILAAALLFAGCATFPREVAIPIAVPCPAPPELPPLDLPLAALQSGTSAAESSRAVAIIVEKLFTRIQELERILAGYKPQGGQ